MSRKPNRAGSIVRRKDGRYQGALEADGARRFIYGKTEHEVARKLEALKAHMVTLGGLPNPGTRTVNDLLNAWLKAVGPTLKPRTLNDYTVLCARYVRPAIGTVRLGRLNPYHLQRLYADLQGRNLARVPSQVHVAMHRAFRLAVLWRWLPENPCDRVVRPAYHAVRKEVWSPAHMHTFISQTREHWLWPLWVFLIASGCRIGEALALRWDDLQGEAVNIRRNVQRIRGEWVTGEPKTKAGRRTLTLPPFAVDALRRQRVRQAEYCLAAGGDWPDTSLVFTGRGGEPIQQTTVAHALKAACRGLGLPPLSPHGLRHLNASLLIAHGVPVTAVSARLGHSKVSVTLDVYSHLVGGEDRQAAAILGDVVTGTR